MKPFFIIFCISITFWSQHALAQDTMSRDTTARDTMSRDTTDSRPARRNYVRRGTSVWGSGALTRNSNFASIRRELTTAGADVSLIGDYQVQGGISFITDTRRGYSETRFLYTSTNGDDEDNTASLTKRANFSGFGAGSGYTWKVVNSRRFIVGPSLGYHLMWYRLAIKPQDAQNIPLAAVVANPAVYNTVRFRQGFYSEGFAGISADLRLYWFKRVYDEIRFGARVGYQTPLLASRTWRYDDGEVPGLSAFRSRMLFAQFGVTFFTRTRRSDSAPTGQGRTRPRRDAL